MASFGTVALPDNRNSLLDLASIDQNVNQTLAGRIGNQTNQQNLDDRSTLRDLAPGLASGDLGSLATAATLGPSGTGAIAGIDAARTSQRTNLSAYQSMAANLAGSIAALPADQQATAYSIGRQSLINAGMPSQMLPDQHPGTAGLLALRNAQIPAVEQVKLNADYPDFTGGAPRGPMGPPIGGGNLPAPGSGALPGPGAPSGSAQPPGVGAPGGNIEQQLGGGESGNRPGAVNQQGYSGQFQFGTGRLTDLKMYQPAPGENPNGNTWQGQFNIPGFPDVKTYQDFLANPDAQRAAMHVHVDDIRQKIAAIPGADQLSPAGLVAVAHLGGVTGMQKFVQSGGAYNPRDRNGTSLSDYYTKYAQAGLPALAADHGHPGGPLLPSAGQQQAGAPNSGSASPFVIGDSIAQGVQMANGLPGTAVQGASPDAVLDSINAIPADGLRGRTVVLSSGVSNDPAKLAVVQQQLDSLRARGARVTLLGVGNRADLAPLNGPLAALAQRNGATFQPIQAGPDGVHPANYRGLGTPQPQQTASVDGTAGLPQVANDAAPPGQPGTVTSATPDQLAGTMATLRLRQADPAGTAPDAQPSAPPGATVDMNGNPVAPTGGTMQTQPGLNPLLQALPPGQAPGAPRQNPLLAYAAPRAAPAAPNALMPSAPPAPAAPAAPPAPPRVIIGTQKGLPIPVKGQPQMVMGTVNGGPPQAVPLPGAVNTGRLTPMRRPDGGTDLIAPSGQTVTSGPANTRDVQIQMYKEDRGLAQQQSEAAMMAQQQQGKLLEARQVLAGLPTGANGEARAAWANYAETYMSPSFAQAFKAKLGLPDAVPAQEFGKLMTQSAGQQERQVAGARGGIQMMQLFKSANPGLEMQPNANRDILNMQLVAAQADQDYAKGHIAWVNEHGADLMRGGQYQPASQFDQQWIAQRNPQIYLAATNAMNGKPVDQWTKGLKPDEIPRVRQIIANIDPTTTVMGPGGRPFRVSGGQQQGAAQ